MPDLPATCDVQGCDEPAVCEVKSELNHGERWLPACQHHQDEAWEVGLTIRKVQRHA